jgi:hypothetical protein
VADIESHRAHAAPSASFPAAGGGANARAPQPEPRAQVVAELEANAGFIRLHVTEDALGYGVSAVCEDVAAEAFDVQLQARRVWIGRSAHAPDPRATPRLERRGIERLFSLAFDHAIDPSGSHGECTNGSLYLWLRKTGMDEGAAAHAPA